jgi:hypothetical protein
MKKTNEPFQGTWSIVEIEARDQEYVNVGQERQSAGELCIDENTLSATGKTVTVQENRLQIGLTQEISLCNAAEVISAGPGSIEILVGKFLSLCYINKIDN